MAADAVLLWSASLLIAVSVGVLVSSRVVRRKYILPILVAAGGLIVAVLAGAVVGTVIGHLLQPAARGTPSSDQSAPSGSLTTSSPAPASGAVITTGTISVPVNGADVAAYAMVAASGTVQNLPAGYRLDLFIKFAGVDAYYASGDPNSALKLADGRWSGSIYIALTPWGPGEDRRHQLPAGSGDRHLGAVRVGRPAGGDRRAVP